jgi:hypothetical protein
MTAQTYTPAADFMLPFSMPHLGVRGRVVRGSTLLLYPRCAGAS